MPVSYRIDTGQQLAILTATGVTTTDDFTRALRQLAADPEWRPSYCRLWDWREIALDHVALRAIRDAARIAQDDRLACRRTAVVAVGRIDREVARAIKGSVKTHEVEVFSTMPEALAWLSATVAGEDLE